jgi:hypothetical protein
MVRSSACHSRDSFEALIIEVDQVSLPSVQVYGHVRHLRICAAAIRFAEGM